MRGDLSEEKWRIDPGTAAAILDEKDCLVATVANYGDVEDALAIARLLAAAPKLLKALKLLADDHEHGETGTVRQEHLKLAREALKEARDA